MADVKTIAIIAIVVVAMGVAGVFLINSGDDDSGDKITIIDGAGKKIVLDEPLDSVVVGNTNVPKMCNILGAQDRVKGLSFYAAGSNNSNWEKYSPLFPDAKHMSIEPQMTAEEVIKVAKAVIVPVSSMTISYAQELSYKEMGIKVIRLNCNGETAKEDMEKLTILFGKDEKIMANYNEYWDHYNAVMETITEKAKSSEEFRFLYYYSGLTSFYNQTSASNDLPESIGGKNALREISNAANQLGMREAVLELDNSKPIDYFFFRASSTTTSESAAEKAFTDSEIYKNYMSLSSVKNNEIYMFMSEPMSGCLSFVGYVLMAEAVGIDPGYEPSELIEEYNERYGFHELTSGILFKITVDGTTVSAEQIF